MKNTLKIALMVIGAAFVGYGVFRIFFSETRVQPSQNYAILGIGLLFLLAGLSMKKL